jgi:hypothetical protein
VLYSWVMPLALFIVVILEIGPLFCPGWHGLWSFYSTLSAIAGMTGAHHHAQFFSVEMGTCKLFTRAGLETQSSNVSLLSSLW